eukprot:15327834-Alexandrium_andersonii.AAC.1
MSRNNCLLDGPSGQSKLIGTRLSPRRPLSQLPQPANGHHHGWELANVREPHNADPSGRDAAR